MFHQTVRKVDDLRYMDLDTNAEPTSTGAEPLAIRRANWKTAENPSARLVELVADATGRTQTELEPLQYTLDGDALNALLETADTQHLTITFTYENLDVRVASDGLVEVHQ